MTDERPWLSICIPTYRRPKPLRECLESLAAQDFPLNYELRVRDNCSPDETGDVFRETARGRLNWHYERNSENIGGRSNLRKVSGDAVGEFLIILGDDDKFVPKAFEALHHLIVEARRTGANAVFMHTALGPDYAGRGGKLFEPQFRWLRKTGINSPAFITSVVWRRSFWEAFPFEELPRDAVRLPQLRCFIEACRSGQVVGYGGPVYTMGIDDTNSPSYAFYTQAPYIDCYEYPLYYRTAYRSGRIDARTRLVATIRQWKWLRDVYGKMLFMRYNEAYYRPTLAGFREAHGSFAYWPGMVVVYWLIFKTALGRMLARRRCGHEPKIDPSFQELY